MEMFGLTRALLVMCALGGGVFELTGGIQGADTVRLCPKAQQGRSYVFECSGTTASTDRFIYWQGSHNSTLFEIGRCYFEDTICKTDDPAKFNITNLPDGREFKSLLIFRNVSESDRDMIINCSVWDIDYSDEKEVVDACRLTLFNPGEKSVVLGKPENQLNCVSGTEISYKINCSANMFTTDPDISLYVGDVKQKDGSSMSSTEIQGGKRYYWRTTLFVLTLNQSDQGKAIRCMATEKLPNSPPLIDQFDIRLPQITRQPYFTNSSGVAQERMMTLGKGQNERIECVSPMSTIYITCSGAGVQPVTQSWTQSDSASLTLNGSKINNNAICYCQTSYRGQCANVTTYLIISSPGSGSAKNSPNFAKWSPLFYVLAAVISLIFVTIILGASVYFYKHWKKLGFCPLEKPNHYDYIDPKPEGGYKYQNVAPKDSESHIQRESSVSSDGGGVFQSNFSGPPIDLRQPDASWEPKPGFGDDCVTRCVSFHQNDPAPPRCGLPAKETSGREATSKTSPEDDRTYVEPVDVYETNIPSEPSLGAVGMTSGDQYGTDEAADDTSHPPNDLSLGPDPSRGSEWTYTNCFSDVSNDYNVNPELENLYIEPSSRASSVDDVNRAEEEYLINLLKLDAEA
ncbi:unnamed protein product [Lymnaea stagnalis]|uniref:Ig-like domain-containing protein n=1 Tax=Lymnaea stagnalis TaxID=6523 RepID=A0AAV2I705_LYMST